MIAICLSSRAELIKKEVLHGCQLQKSKKDEARHSGTLFNTSIDGVKPGKRLIVSLYLNELLG